MEAAHPMFGKITIKRAGADASPQSTLHCGPAGLVHTQSLEFTLTFERCGDAAGPFQFSTLAPAKLVANLAAFPPPPQSTNPDGSPVGGQLYQLTAPVSLGVIDSGGQNTEYAQLQGMNINLGRLSG